MTENVYQSDLRWFAGAAVLEILAVLLVLPLFWGWWNLDKMAILSPFDLALAFDAPLLKKANSAKGARWVVQEMGDVRVKYSVVKGGQKCVDTDSDVTAVSGDAVYRLGIGEIETVMTPPKGMLFDV